jgi:hypothetical protein
MGSKQKNAKGWAHLPPEMLQSVDSFYPLWHLSPGACWGRSLAANIRDMFSSLDPPIFTFLFYHNFGSILNLSPLARVTTPLDDPKHSSIPHLLITRLYCPFILKYA